MRKHALAALVIAPLMVACSASLRGNAQVAVLKKPLPAGTVEDGKAAATLPTLVEVRGYIEAIGVEKTRELLSKRLGEVDVETLIAQALAVCNLCEK